MAETVARYDTTTPAADYDTDFCQWAEQQAAALLRGNFSQLDLVNLADEVADLSQRNKDQLESRLIRIYQHLAKWRELESIRELHANSWRNTIDGQREDVERLIKKNPSLKSYIDAEILEYIAKKGQRAAVKENPDKSLGFFDIGILTLQQLLDDDY